MKDELEKLIEDAVHGGKEVPVDFDELERLYSHLKPGLKKTFLEGFRSKTSLRWQQATERWAVGIRHVVEVVEDAVGLTLEPAMAARSADGANPMLRRPQAGPIFSQTNGRETAVVRFVGSTEQVAELHVSMLARDRKPQAFFLTVRSADGELVSGPRHVDRNGVALQLPTGAYFLGFGSHPDSGYGEMELHLTTTQPAVSAPASSPAQDA